MTAVQVRLKAAAPSSLVELVRRLKRELAIPVLVNDRLDVAIAGGADGVHLGPDDVPVPLARSVTPPGFIIGASVGSAGEAKEGREADYWGIGPYRATPTKADAGTALGVEGLAEIVALARGQVCLAIGGIEPEDMPGILRSGVTGVAVVSGILREADVAGAARRYAGYGLRARRD